MKKIFCSLSLLIVLLLGAASCRQRTVIPDDELAHIFRDAFLVNAYVYDQKIEFDTLQVYQPIFDYYGYSIEDVAYTVGSFSKRKSARLSDVVERSIKLLEQGESGYAKETAILDTIDAIALRRATRTIYHADEVTFYDQRDTTSLRIELDSIAPGSIKISFDYMVDSLDNNRSSYRTMSWVEYPGIATKKGLSTSYLRKKQVESVNRTIKSDTLTHRLVIELAESYEVKRTPHITFRNIKVNHTPTTEVAVEEFFAKKLDIKIFANDFFAVQPTDSLELSPL